MQRVNHGSHGEWDIKDEWILKRCKWNHFKSLFSPVFGNWKMSSNTPDRYKTNRKSGEQKCH